MIARSPREGLDPAKAPRCGSPTERRKRRKRWSSATWPSTSPGWAGSGEDPPRDAGFDAGAGTRRGGRAAPSRGCHDVELVRIVTEGDVRPVDSTPGEGMFVTALASVLKRREIDIAAHSARDVPLEEDPELLTAAYPGIHSWPIWASRSTGSTKS
ncbi:MAG: hypothetical protein E6I27_18330, partial [Chloroflexi bacterium]